MNQYQTTTHFNGQSILVVKGEQASGESYCIAHHIIADAEKRMMMTASLRYIDAFVKQDRRWLFAERKLMVDWTETCALVS